MNNDALQEILTCPKININELTVDKLNCLFETANEQMMPVYHFAMRYAEYINNKHDYTSEVPLTMIEAHLLTDICDYPNSTVTSLASAWHRSTSATSQTIRKLIEKGLITRENSAQDAKVFFLHATEKGVQISEIHKRYDVLDIVKTLKALNRTLSEEEIKIMFKGLNEYIKLLHK